MPDITSLTTCVSKLEKTTFGKWFGPTLKSSLWKTSKFVSFRKSLPKLLLLLPFAHSYQYHNKKQETNIYSKNIKYTNDELIFIQMVFKINIRNFRIWKTKYFDYDFRIGTKILLSGFSFDVSRVHKTLFQDAVGAR